MQSITRNAVLKRLKEIDEKYRQKKSQQQPISPSSSIESNYFDNIEKNGEFTPVSASGDVSEYLERELNVKTQNNHEKGKKVNDLNDNVETSTLVLNFNKNNCSEISLSSDHNSTSRIIIKINSNKEEIGPSGEGDVITNVDVTLYKVQSDKTSSVSSITEDLDQENRTLCGEIDECVQEFNKDCINREINNKSVSIMENLPNTNTSSINVNDFHYSDEIFEDLSSDSQSGSSIENEKRSESNFKKQLNDKNQNSESHLGTDITHDTSRRIIDENSSKIVENNKFMEMIEATMRSESSKYEDEEIETEFTKDEKRVKNTNSEVSQLYSFQYSKTFKEENNKSRKLSLRNKNMINETSDSKFIQLYENPCTNDSEDSEQALSISYTREISKKSILTREKSENSDNLSQISGNDRRDFDRKTDDSIKRDSQHEDFSIKYSLHKNSTNKSIFKTVTEIELPVEQVNSIKSLQRSNNELRRKSNDKAELNTMNCNHYKRVKVKNLKERKFRKIPTEIPPQLKVRENHIYSSTKYSWISEEKKHQLFDEGKQINKHLLFKSLEFPKIAAFNDEFVKGKVEDSKEALRERLFEIQQWLKLQYNLYQDCCKLVTAINEQYKTDILS